jgi:hypothetical protein
VLPPNAEARALSWSPIDQAVQIVGALLILAAYAAAQFGLLDQSSRAYLILNLVGSVVLAVLAWHEDQLGFLLLEGSGHWFRGGALPKCCEAESPWPRISRARLVR